ncbi:ABC transporter substrate-binding protein [Streptomyces sp. NPDC054796]
MTTHTRTRTRTRAVTRTALAAALALLAASACSGKSTAGGGDGQDAQGVKTGAGVTEETITLGALTDMTGVYASLGKSVTQAQQLYIKQTNKDGGICGRKLDLTVRDHGYDAGKAIPAYTELEPEVLGFVQFLGSPFVSAAKSRIEKEDKVLVIPMAWSASLLGDEHIRVIGATYDVETANAVDFLVKEKGLKKGDKVGHVYFEGDYGENALEGAEEAAKKHGLTLVKQKIKPTDEDMSAQVSAFDKAGVKAALVSAGPRQAASLVGLAAASGLKIPIAGNNSAFAPQLLKTQAGKALQGDYYVAASTLPIGSEEPGPSKLARAYAAEYPKAVLDNGVIAGYNATAVYVQALKKACEAKDLTREGVTKALLSLRAYGNGFGITHDFSNPDEPSTRESYILKPDEKAKGGLVVVRDAQSAG